MNPGTKELQTSELRPVTGQLEVFVPPTLPHVANDMDLLESIHNNADSTRSLRQSIITAVVVPLIQKMCTCRVLVSTVVEMRVNEGDPDADLMHVCEEIVTADASELRSVSIGENNIGDVTRTRLAITIERIIMSAATSRAHSYPVSITIIRVRDYEKQRRHASHYIVDHKRLCVVRPGAERPNSPQSIFAMGYDDPSSFLMTAQVEVGEPSLDFMHLVDMDELVDWASKLVAAHGGDNIGRKVSMKVTSHVHGDHVDKKRFGNHIMGTILDRQSANVVFECDGLHEFPLYSGTFELRSRVSGHAGVWSKRTPSFKCAVVHMLSRVVAHMFLCNSQTGATHACVRVNDVDYAGPVDRYFTVALRPQTTPAPEPGPQPLSESLDDMRAFHNHLYVPDLFHGDFEAAGVDSMSP